MNKNPAIIHNNFEIHKSTGEKIVGDIRRPIGDANDIVIIIAHSFMAFKDWGFFPFVAEEFTKSGYTTVLFNFSYNGVVGHNDRITDFSKFSRNTFSREVDDLQAIIEKIIDGTIETRRSGSTKLILLGHSRGGGISIITASRDNRVHGLVTWSSIATFDRWTEHQKLLWRRQGFLPLSKATGVSPLKLELDLLRDIEDNVEPLNILNAAHRITIPWLIVHGTVDLTVPIREGEMLYDAASSKAVQFVRLGTVGHLYNAANRGEDQYATLESLIKITHTWIEKTLS